VTVDGLRGTLGGLAGGRAGGRLVQCEVRRGRRCGVERQWRVDAALPYEVFAVAQSLKSSVPPLVTNDSGSHGLVEVLR
jgi:hypothetical protein